MFYCGIDVAKQKHAVAVLDEHGQAQKPVFAAENTHAGMEFLLAQLQPFGEEVCIGLEATGHYWLSLYDVLTRQGYAVSVINPLQISAYRKSGVLNFILCDHLGSTSLVTNANGTKVSEMRYRVASLWGKALGEVRYESGASPTCYTYTGQYSYTADFGLMFYNARWYDPSINHFTQPDTIVPDSYNPLDWNRYSYVRYNPLK